MTTVFRAVNTLVLVEQADKAEQIAWQLRSTGIAIQQNWVDNATEFSIALQRDVFDLAIIYRVAGETDLPAAVLRYPDTPFLVILSQYRNRAAEQLLTNGAADVVGFSHMVRLQKVLTRMVSDVELRKQHESLQEQYISQHTMLQSLLNGTQEAIAYLHHGMHSYGNPAYRQLTGLTDDEHVQRTTLLDLIAPQDQANLNTALRKMGSTHCGHTTLDCHLIHQDGSRIPVALTLAQSWYDGESVLQMTVRRQKFDYTSGTYRQQTTPSADSYTHHQLEAAGIHLKTEPVNCLRADIYERFCVHVQHITGGTTDLLSDDRSGMTLIDLDRCVILDAINKLNTRLKQNPNTQFLIPLQAEAAQHFGLTQWLQQHIQARNLPARAVTLMLPLANGSNTFAEHFELTRQMQLAGVGVCIRGISGTTEEQLYLSTNDIDYALLTPSCNGHSAPQHFDANTTDNPPLDSALLNAIKIQIKICQKANVKTMIAANHPADIAALWKLGVDCLIGDLEAQLDCAQVY